MATYNELYNLRVNSELRNRVAVAALVAAYNILIESPPVAERVAWAKQAIASPDNVGQCMLECVLAANKSATVANIIGATDTQIQTNVDAVIDGIVS